MLTDHRRPDGPSRLTNDLHFRLPPEEPLPLEAEEQAVLSASTIPTILLTVVTVVAGLGFDRVFAGHSWLGPVVITAVISHALAYGLRRLRVATAPAVLIGVVVVILLSFWTVLGGTTTAGLPLGPTFSALNTSLDTAHHAISRVNAPAPDLAGFRLLAVWGVGLVAVLGDWAAFRLRTALQALTPTFALFVVCCVLGRTAGRLWSLVLVVGAMALFVLVQRNTVGRIGTVWFGNRPRGAVPWRTGALIAAVTVVGAAAAVPAMAPSEGRGALGWKHGSSGPSGTRSVISPIVDLRTRLVSEPNTLVMTVTSPVSSYWRLTSLDTFTGVQWQSTNSYYAVGKRLPGVGKAPPDTRQINEQFDLLNLDSIWLPAAFYPESVTGGGKVTWDPISGSLLTDQSSADNLRYGVTSLQYLATLNPQALESAPAPVINGSLSQDVQLPDSIPPQVHQLALQITAGKKTEYDKALALQNFFYGPSFSYSLDPPTDGYGTDALTNFLFQTREGYCQQFAGSYAVLARSIGLPTRLAVGFTAGTALPGNQYSVTDADAHTWPEVYFPGYGWLPFEPTKGGFSVPGATAYTGDTSAGLPTTTPTRPTPAPTPTQPTAKPHATTQPGGSAATVPPVGSGKGGGHVRTTHAHRGASLAWLLWLGVAVALILAWLALIALGRRWRWARRDRTDPAARVLASWSEAEELLAWWGLRRRREETFVELARRAGPVLGRSPRRRVRGTSPGTAEASSHLTDLARWASAAGYGASTIDRATAVAAESGRRALASDLHRRAGWRRLLRWHADPRAAWGR